MGKTSENEQRRPIHDNRVSLTTSPKILPFDSNGWATTRPFTRKTNGSNTGAATGIMTFVELKPSADPIAINKAAHGLCPDKSPGAAMKGFLFPMSEWRLYSSFKNGKQDAFQRQDQIRPHLRHHCLDHSAHRLYQLHEPCYRQLGATRPRSGRQESPRCR